MDKYMKKNEIRERKVLIHLIEEYIKYGEPVSSKIICDKYLDDVSPATVRIDLHKLEKKSLIFQPHTSAGRNPTIAGYRHYLTSQENNILSMSYDQEKLLRNILISSYKDTATTLHYVMQLLAKSTDQLSFVAEPEIAYGFLDKLEVFKIANNKLLFVVSLDTGIDKIVIINTDHEINEQQLRALVRYTNESLAGMRIYDIQNKYIEELTEKSNDVNQIFNHFLRELERALNEMSNFFIHFEAGISFLEQKEFDEKASLLSFLSLTQRQDQLVNMMQKGITDKPFQVLLGEDFVRHEWFNYALVYSRYEMYGIPGFLGVLSPVRMDYLKNISTVYNMAKIITETTKKGSMVISGD